MIDYFGNNPRDKALNFAFPFVATACMKAKYEADRDRAIKDVAQLINDFPEYKDLITKKLISDLSLHIKEKRVKLKDADKSNAVAASQLKQLAHAENILNWLNDGMNVSGNKVSKRKDYTQTNWFRIGLLFATGEMDKLLEKHNNNPTQVAKHLGNETGYRPFISATHGKTQGNNIYANRDKMEKIQAYCQEKNIAPTAHFTAAYKRLK